MSKKIVTDDMSGHCRFGSNPSHHRRCRVQWTTPSAEVTCECACHRAVVKKVVKVVAKVPTKPVTKPASGVVVKKSLH